MLFIVQNLSMIQFEHQTELLVNDVRESRFVAMLRMAKTFVHPSGELEARLRSESRIMVLQQPAPFDWPARKLPRDRQQHAINAGHALLVNATKARTQINNRTANEQIHSAFAFYTHQTTINRNFRNSNRK